MIYPPVCHARTFYPQHRQKLVKERFLLLCWEADDIIFVSRDRIGYVHLVYIRLQNFFTRTKPDCRSYNLSRRGFGNIHPSCYYSTLNLPSSQFMGVSVFAGEKGWGYVDNVN